MHASKACCEDKVLEIEKLSIVLPSGADRALAIKDVSFSVKSGSTLCLVGESGSGKSVIGQAVAGLLPQTLHCLKQSSIRLGGRNLLSLDECAWRRIRGREIGMVFQEPMTALNPLMPVGQQIAEVYRSHGLRLRKAEVRDRVEGLLERVGIKDPARISKSYTFRMSGGQRQRAMIAMAVAMKPKVLIADEPTTALDVTTQRQVLDLLADLQAETRMALIFITHDFGIVADIADEVAVMESGNLVEFGSKEDVLARAQHRYTRKLLAAVPRLHEHKASVAERSTPVLEVRGLSKTYGVATSIFRRQDMRVLNDVNFKVCKGEVVALVGESGSGKSTIAKCLTRLTSIDTGSIRLDGADMLSLKGEALMKLRRKVQIVFQDPYGSLNPRQKIVDAVSAGPIAQGVASREARELAEHLLTIVGLGRNALDRYPHEFSGGQRQRIGIARALAAKPEVLIADEAVSALDVTVQAQILRLLADLRDRLGLTMLFITHDLRVAGQVSDRIIVLKAGNVVEEGPTQAIFTKPSNQYTYSLLQAIPGISSNESALVRNKCVC